MTRRHVAAVAAIMAASSGCGDSFQMDLFPGGGGGAGWAVGGADAGAGNGGGGTSAGGSAGHQGGAGASGAQGGAGAAGSGGVGGSGAGGAGAGGSGGDGAGGGYTGPPSCEGLAPNCGASQDCCAGLSVPAGMFNRSSDPQYPAAVSGFELDRYQVTVGRFRAFVAAYPGSAPAAGDGAHPILGAGWQSEWTSELPATKAALKAALGCSPPYHTWTDSPGPAEVRPINCTTWYLAFAFCAWDGGRLPTEAEWNYAAAGGSEQRLYPWGGAAPTPGHASFDCLADGVPGCNGATDPQPVGSYSPLGDGRWGHADLSGNVEEWTLDTFGPYPLPCTDCAQLAAHPDRRVRGGGYAGSALAQQTATRDWWQADLARNYQGLRCAR